VRVVAELLGDAGEPGQWSLAGRQVVVEAPVEDGGAVVGGVQLAGAGGDLERGGGVGAGGGEQDEVGAQGGPRGVVGDAGDDPVGTGLQRGDSGGAEVVFCGDGEGVEVAGGGGAEPQGGGEVVAGGGGG
jgi:hypothetical protein